MGGVSLKKDDLCIRQPFAEAASHPRHFAQLASTCRQHGAKEDDIRRDKRWAMKQWSLHLKLTGTESRVKLRNSKFFDAFSRLTLMTMITNLLTRLSEN